MKKSILGLSLLLTLVLLSGPALAHRNGGGMMHGDDADAGYGFCDRYSSVDKDEVLAVTAKYADQFEALRGKMDAQRDAMHKARSNDATTVGQLNKLRDEMHAVKKEYRELRAKVDGELGEKFGALDDDERCGMMGGGPHRGKQGMMGGAGPRHEMMSGTGCSGGCR